MEDHDDHLLEDWARRMGTALTEAPGGLVSFYLMSLYPVEGMTCTIDALNGPVLQQDFAGNIVSSPGFGWSAPAQQALDELKGQSGPYTAVPRLLGQRWQRATKPPNPSHLGAYLWSLSWPVGSAEISLAFLLEQDPAHRSRYRARHLEQRLDGDLTVVHKDRL